MWSIWKAGSEDGPENVQSVETSGSIAAPANSTATQAARPFSVLYNRSGVWRVPWRLLMYLASSIALMMPAVFVSALLSSGGGFAPSGGVYYVLICIAWLLPALLLLRFVDRKERPLAAYGLSVHPGLGREFLLGGAWGAGIVVLVWLVEWSLGWLNVEFYDFDLLPLLTTFSLIFFAALFEELVFRGYVMQLLIEGLGRWPALLITSLLFGYAHNDNPSANLISFTVTALAGILIGLSYVRTRSLWVPTVLHVAWNYTMGVVLGMQVSGLEMPARLLESSLTFAGIDLERWGARCLWARSGAALAGRPAGGNRLLDVRTDLRGRRVRPCLAPRFVGDGS